MTDTGDGITYVDVKPAPGALIWPRELDEGSHVHHRMTGECLKRLDGPTCDAPAPTAPDRASRYYSAMTSSPTRSLDAVLRLVDEETAELRALVDELLGKLSGMTHGTPGADWHGLGGYAVKVCTCIEGPYLGARMSGTPCRCERCGFITRDQLDAILAVTQR